MKRQKDAPPDETDGAKQQAAPDGNTESAQRKPSWRDFYKIHEAAAFFHAFSEEDPEREQLKELAADINKKRVIYDPIHTANVPLRAGEFVIDGISRLDALEAADIQVVDENGNWTGILSNVGGSRQMRIDHGSKTDEEIWEIVRSLNGRRRHLTKEQLARTIAVEVKAEAKKNSRSIARSFSPTSGKRGGSTKDPIKKEVVKRAREKGISKRTAEAALAEDKSQKPTKPPKDVPFEDQVYKKWTAFANNVTPQQRRELLPQFGEWIDWLNRVPDALEFIQKWMQWLNRFPKAQHSKVIQLIPDWIGHDQKEGNDRE